MKLTARPEIDTRPMRPGDIMPLAWIEKHGGPGAWPADRIGRFSRRQDAAVVVATVDGRPAAFAACRLTRGRVGVLRLSVSRWRRRRGLGRWLLGRCLLLPSAIDAGRVGIPAREDDLAAQLWLRACGARCFAIRHGMYDGGRTDGYLFALARE